LAEAVIGFGGRPYFRSSWIGRTRRWVRGFSVSRWPWCTNYGSADRDRSWCRPSWPWCPLIRGYRSNAYRVLWGWAGLNFLAW